MDSQYIFLVIWFLLIFLIVFFFIRNGREALTIFPDLNSVKVLFQEKRVSGYSAKNWMTKMGGAQNVLEVILTKNELWIRSNMLFAGFGTRYDLLHKISLKQVKLLSAQDRSVVLEIRGNDGMVRNIHLRMRKAQEFVLSMQHAKQEVNL
nr:hypothetical protein [uncultured Carboxylicivirga sp.]